VRISPDLQLRCSRGQRWTGYRFKGQKIKGQGSARTQMVKCHNCIV